MTTYPEEASGGCMCGAVRYHVEGAPLSSIFCHCMSCRRHTGAPVVALAGYRRDQVTYTKGQPRIFESSPGVGRAFCGDCGTPMTWEGDGGEIGPMVEFLINTFDNPQDFEPECHIHHQERLPWLEIHDALPRATASGMTETMRPICMGRQTRPRLLRPPSGHPARLLRRFAVTGHHRLLRPRCPMR